VKTAIATWQKSLIFAAFREIKVMFISKGMDVLLLQKA
jgi:hypothetical protein